MGRDPMSKAKHIVTMPNGETAERTSSRVYVYAIVLEYPEPQKDGRRCYAVAWASSERLARKALQAWSYCPNERRAHMLPVTRS
jgi:hypothetical protein